MSDPNNVTNPSNAENFISNLFALDIINSSKDLLPNYNLKFIDTDCGNLIYDHDFYYSCLKQQDYLGLAFLSTDSQDASMGYVEVFRELGLKIPHVSTTSNCPDLYDRKAYPEFISLTPESNYMSKIIAQYVRIFGWKNIAVLYHDSDHSKTDYDSLMEACLAFGISVINTKRMLPKEYTRDQFMLYKDVFEDIKNSKTKIVVSLL